MGRLHLGESPEVPDREIVHGRENVGSASGVSIKTSAFHLIRFERGRVRRYQNFTTCQDALAAAES